MVFKSPMKRQSGGILSRMSVLILLFVVQFVAPESHAQDTLWFDGGFRTVKNINIAHVYPKSKVADPIDTINNHKKRIEWSHKMAACQIVQLNQILSPLWEMDVKKGIVEAWDNDTFLVKRFGIARRYRNINKVRRIAARHEKLLVNGRVEYLDENRNKNSIHNRRLTATTIPGVPKKIRLYLPFFNPAFDTIFLGGTIHHELIHEARLVGHPSRKYKTSSGWEAWEKAALQLAREKPRKAKKSPHAWGYACRAIDVSSYTFSE